MRAEGGTSLWDEDKNLRTCLLLCPFMNLISGSSVGHRALVQLMVLGMSSVL